MASEERTTDGPEEEQEPEYRIHSQAEALLRFKTEYDGTPDEEGQLRYSSTATMLAASASGLDVIRALVIDAAMLGYWYGITDATGEEVPGWSGDWEDPALHGLYGQYPIDVSQIVQAPDDGRTDDTPEEPGDNDEEEAEAKDA